MVGPLTKLTNHDVVLGATLIASFTLTLKPQWCRIWCVYLPLFKYPHITTPHLVCCLWKWTMKWFWSWTTSGSTLGCRAGDSLLKMKRWDAEQMTRYQRAMSDCLAFCQTDLQHLVQSSTHSFIKCVWVGVCRCIPDRLTLFTNYFLVLRSLLTSWPYFISLTMFWVFGMNQ